MTVNDRLIKRMEGMHVLKNVTQKTIAAIVAGTFLLAGAAMPFMAQAATDGKDRPATHQRQVNPEKAAARIAADYGISQETILKYHKQGVSFRDLHRAALLAKAGGKSFEAVLAQKTPDKNWPQVAAELGVDKNRIKAARQDVTAGRLNARLGIDKAAALELLSDGYKSRDIAMAGMLSKNTGKTMPEILSLKRINNTWKDVAQTLGVDRETFKSDRKALHQAFPRQFKQHHKDGKMSLS